MLSRSRSPAASALPHREASPTCTRHWAPGTTSVLSTQYCPLGTWDSGLPSELSLETLVNHPWGCRVVGGKHWECPPQGGSEGIDPCPTHRYLSTVFTNRPARDGFLLSARAEEGLCAQPRCSEPPWCSHSRKRPFLRVAAHFPGRPHSSSSGFRDLFPRKEGPPARASANGVATTPERPAPQGAAALIPRHLCGGAVWKQGGASQAREEESRFHH